MTTAINILKAMKRKAEIKRWTGCGYMIETLDEAIYKIEALGDGWIPVTIETPNALESVIVYKKSSIGANSIFTCLWDDEYCESIGVTHWMPLPKIPN